ncbi:MAG TPA: ABC transporter ATP-binding protein [Chloroflexota bacterium]
MIRAVDLARAFGGLRAVDRFSFEVEPGEIYGLLGPNGAGKTTTTRMLSCLLRPTSGTAWVAGYSIDTAAQSIRSRIGILTEVPGLYGRLTPFEYLDFFASVQDVPRARRAARIEEVLRLVDMWERRQSMMRAFSKGMQQRVAIARALLHDPQVLFFDEPTAALDPEAARRVRDHLRDLAAEHRRTVLLCTHNLTEAEELCHRLSIVRGGKQIAEGTPAQLKAGLPRAMTLRVGSISATLRARVSAVTGVDACETVPAQQVIRYQTTTPRRTNPEVVRTVVAAGVDVLALEECEPSLEEVYLAMVRREQPHDSPADRAGVIDGRMVEASV